MLKFSNDEVRTNIVFFTAFAACIPSTAKLSSVEGTPKEWNAQWIGAPWHPGFGGGVAWGAAMNSIPWEHYVHYGDISVLEECFDAMCGQLDYMCSWRTASGIMDMKMPSLLKSDNQ